MLHLFQLRRVWLRVGLPQHFPANCPEPGEQDCVRADALFVPLVQHLTNIQHAAAIVAGDNSRDSLHQVCFVAFAILVGKIAERMRVRINETRRNHQTRRVDNPHRSQVCLARVADKDDAIAANANVGRSRFLTRTVDEFAVKNQEIELLARNRLRVRRCVSNVRERDQCDRDYQRNGAANN